MHKNFKIDQTKIKGGSQSGRKVVPHDSKSDLPLVSAHNTYPCQKKGIQLCLSNPWGHIMCSSLVSITQLCRAKPITFFAALTREELPLLADQIELREC